MYFADISNAGIINIYKGLLDQYLEKPNSEETKSLFEDIILTAHKLATKEISENKIDHKIYNLITALIDHNKDYNRHYFETIDPNKIGIEQFKTLSGILSSLIVSDHELV